MTDLNVGGVFGTVELITVSFDRTYARVVGQVEDLGRKFEQVAGRTATLDRSMAEVAGATDKASVSMTRAEQSAARQAAAQEKAAAAAARQAEASRQVAATMAGVADASLKVQQSTLQQTAAQQRLAAASAETGSAQQLQARETARLASAQASAIGASRALATAQTEAGAASREGMLGMVGGMSGMLKMAGELGLVVGAFEAVKKAIDITKEANDFHRQMVQTQTTADVTAAEVNKASGALLNMAGKVAASPTDLATAWYHAKSVGLDYADSLKATQIAAEGARIGNASVEETMNALTASVASGIPGVKNMSSAMGQLLSIVGSGDMSLSDLNKALGSGLLVNMKQYGLSLTDVGAALAVFGDHNVRGANAATMLRLSVQAMTVPAKAGAKLMDELGLTSEGSAAALAKVHLTTSTLAQDLQTGGLNKAVLDLKQHLKDAGVSGVQTGEVLTEMFGKKAGPGIAILIGDTDRLESKFKILRDSGASFADKWKATQGTASYALASVGHSAEALGIQITGKLGPAIASGATWFSTTLPHAIHDVQGALGPLEHIVGVALVDAWHTLSAVLSVAGDALGAIGHLAASNSGTLTDLSLATVACWAAFKGVTVGIEAFKAIQTAAVLTSVRVLEVRDSLLAMAAGEKAVSTGLFVGVLAGIGVAAYAAGRGINALVESDNTFAHTLDNLGNIQKTFTAALDASNGALTASVRTSVAAQLQADGLAQKAGKAGISLTQLTDAVTGSGDALGNLVKQWEAQGKPSDDTITALALIQKQYQGAAANAKALGEVTAVKVTPAQQAAAAATQAQANELGVAADAYSAAQDAAKKNTDQTNAQTLAFQLANDAASLLKNALNGLAGVNLSVATAQTGLASSNLQVAAAFKQNGDAINGNSAAAVANQQAIQGQVSAAQQYAEAIGKQTGSSTAAVAAYQASKAAIEDQLRAQGRLTPAVQAYIDKLYDLSNLKVPPTKLDADNSAARAKVAALQAQINAIRQGKNPDVNVNSARGQAVISGLQAQIDALTQHTPPQITANTSAASAAINAIQNQLNNLHGVVALTVDQSGIRAVGGRVSASAAGSASWTRDGKLPPGLSTVGERGWELVSTDTSGRSQVFSHEQSVAMTGLPARLPGFASGTGTATAVASLLASMGYNQAAIAGFLGNFQVESSMNTGAYNARENAHGLAQWEGARWTALQAYAKAHHESATSLNAQLGYLAQELRGSSLGKSLSGVTSASAAAAIIDAQFERSAGTTRGAREAAATGFMGQLSAGHISTLGAGSTTGLSPELSVLSQLAKLGPEKFAASFASNLSGLEQTLTKNGLGSFVNTLGAENKKLLALAKARDTAAANLAAATKAVTAAVATRHSDAGTFANAITSGFDITTAGQDANGHVTGGSLLAAETQQVTRIRAWGTAMSHLSSLKVFPAVYLRSLFAKGPDSLPTVQALLQMSSSQMASFAAGEKSIENLAGGIAWAGATKLDDPAINSAVAAAKRYGRQDAQLNKQIDAGLQQLGDRIEHIFGNGLHATFDFKTGTLALAVATDQRNSAHRKPTHG